MRNKFVQQDRARDGQGIQELRRMCCAEAERARQLKYDEVGLSAIERESFYSESVYASHSGVARQGEFLEWRTRIL